jgi:hypothetical protein
MNVVSVTYFEGGLRTLSVDCDCGSSHSVAWPKGTLTLEGELPCGAELSGLEIPAWCVDPKFRTGFRKYKQRPHSVFPDEAASSPAGEQREDSATEAHYEHNWIE